MRVWKAELIPPLLSTALQPYLLHVSPQLPHKSGHALHPRGDCPGSTFSTLTNMEMKGPVELCAPAAHIWKDIFDLFHIHQDGWEDAAVANSICDKEQQVTADDLLCHKHPARKEQVGEGTSLPLQCQSGITWPTAKKCKENRKRDGSRKWERHSKQLYTWGW